MNSNEQTFPLSKKVTYSKVDSAYAWLMLVLSFLFCHTVPIWKYPLGGFLLVLGAFVSGFIVLGCKKVRLTPASILTAISALVLSAALILAESPFLLFLSYSYCLASFCFFIYAALGNRVEKGFSNYIYIDYIKILFILPYSAILSIFPAIFSHSNRKGSRVFFKILIGIAIAIVPTVIVFALLSYDEGFMEILRDIFAFDIKKLPRWLFSFFFTVPFAMFGFGLYAASCKGTLKNTITAENCDDIHKKVRILPQITAIVATIPIIFLYVIFFVSQWKYFVSGFTGVLPEGFSHAEYARQGFFELCAVSVVNLLCLGAIAVFIGRGRKGKGWMLKILSVVFCLCTFILISTAVAKLIMYIQHYGLTQKRIYAMWLMAVIAVIFLVIALGQFISKIPIVALSFAVFIAMFTPLALCNIHTIVAEYNTDRYLAGTLEEMDIELMEELGDSAIPSLVKLASSLDPETDAELKLHADCILFAKKIELQDEKFQLFAFNLPAYQAKTAIADYEPSLPLAGRYELHCYSINYVADKTSTGVQYPGSGDAPILTLREDGTGTLTYDGFCHLVYMDEYKIFISGEPFSIEYDPFTEYGYDLILNWYNEESGTGFLKLNVAAESV